MSRSPTNIGPAGATGTNHANGPAPGQGIPDRLLPHHRKMLVEESGISEEMVAKSGARSVTDPRELLDLGFLPKQARVPGIPFPILGVRGEVVGWMYRPDTAAGKRKYEIPPGQPNRLYAPPGCREHLGDPSVPLIVVEGIKKAVAVVSKLKLGQAVVAALGGVWNWRGRNARGGKTALPDWEDVALADRDVLVAFDSDTWRKRQVRLALERFTDFLASREARVRWIVLADAADGSKVGADDFLLDHAVDDFLALAVEPPVRVRPSIQANNAKIHEIVEQAWDAVLAIGEIYRRGAELVEIDHEADGRPYLAPVNDYGLLYHLSASADFVAITQARATGGGQASQQVPQLKPVQPPITLARVMLSHAVGVPELRRIIPVPVLGQAGQLIREPGYDPDLGLYYAPGGSPPAIPDAPTTGQVVKARELLRFALSGFPFDGEASRAHAVALMVEPFVRLMIDGPTPLHLIESPTQGSGKGKLAALAMRPYLHGPVPLRAAPDRPEEWEKILTTAVREGTLVFAIDNLKTDLVSPALAAALTTGTYTGRILGASQSVTGRIDWPWIVTANNPTIDTDIARRCVRVRLVPAVEEPWRLDPEAFPIPDLDAWMVENEVGLTEAVLTLVQAWVRAGMPPGAKTLGSYEAWARVVGGVLDVAGIPGFLGNLDEFYDAANAERSGWRAFVQAWWAKHGEQTVTAADLFPLVEEHGFDLQIGGKDEAGKKRSFGRRLAGQRDKIYQDKTGDKNDDKNDKGFQIASEGNTRAGVASWKLVSLRSAGKEGKEGFFPSPTRVNSKADTDGDGSEITHQTLLFQQTPANGSQDRPRSKFEQMTEEAES